MKILLYCPDNGVTKNFMPHLWMFLLQSLTPPKHDVLLIDGNTQPMSMSDPVSPEVQARILSEALPYMQRYDEEIVVVNAPTVSEVIKELQARFPGIQERLVDEKGEVRRFVNVYVNEEDIRFLKNRETPLKDGDEVSIIQAIAGG